MACIYILLYAFCLVFFSFVLFRFDIGSGRRRRRRQCRRFYFFCYFAFGQK